MCTGIIPLAIHRGIYQGSYAKFFLTYFLFFNLILHVEIYRGNYSGKFFKGVEIVWGIFPWRDFSREIFSMWGILRGRKFPLRHREGRISRNFFHVRRISGMI